QPMTPICVIPSNAFGNNAKRSLPPRTIRSSVSPRRITWVSNTLELKSHCIRNTSYVYKWFANETRVFPEASHQEMSAFPLLSAQVRQDCSIMSRQGRTGKKDGEIVVLTEENAGQRRSVQGASTGRW